MLSALIGFPFLGALLVGLWPDSGSAFRSRAIALTVATGLFLWSLVLLGQFDPHQSGLQFQENLPWIESLGLSYRLGADGLALPLVVLNGLLTWVVIYCSGGEQGNALIRPRLYYALILLVSGGIAGALLAQNLLLFFLFYEVELIPVYLLIAIWGGGDRNGAAMKFLLFTAVSGGLILAGFLGLAWLSGATSFDYEILQTLGTQLSPKTQTILLVVLLVGFGIKTPLVPLHTWLPDTYVAASPPIAILLGGLLAKLGTYGLFRFGLGLFPEAWKVLAPGLALWAVVTVAYGSLAAIAQKDIKRMVAYSSIGHMGYVLLGGAAATHLSLVGAISQMVAHGLILALLFNLVGIVEAKVGTRELDVLNGLMHPVRGLPTTSALLILGGMASAGIPGLVGFVAEFLVFQGSYGTFPWQTLGCVVGTGLTAVYFVILLNRTCFGRLDSHLAYYPKVLLTEKIPALVLVTIIFFLGIQPMWLVQWSEQTSAALIAGISEEFNMDTVTKLAELQMLNPLKSTLELTVESTLGSTVESVLE